MKKNEQQKGFALYFIVTMMAVLLASVLGMSNVIIGGVKLAMISRDASKAFYVADSGIERALYTITSSDGAECNIPDGNVGDGSYVVTIVIPDSGTDCSVEGTIITSEGSYGEARKKIEVSFPADD